MSQTTTNHAAVLDDLKARNLFYQCTDEAGLTSHLASPRSLYNGFDPTADSLTIGNLVAIMLLRRFQAHGHTPVVLLGGATGRIGDPSGKDAERTLMTDDVIEQNINAQRQIFGRLLDFDEKRPNHARIVNNDDWFSKMDVYTFLRDIGKHFSVNQMLTRDSVKNRIEREGHGISYTEFSYMLLQAHDFVHLYKEQGVTLQTAGADQWGNIVSGTDLIRRNEHADAPPPSGRGQGEGDSLPLPLGEGRGEGAPAFGLTAPLLTKADGGKFGKSEAGAVWLSTTADRPSGQAGTSAYAYSQFWLNAADEDVERFLLVFDDLKTPQEIAELVEAHKAEPFKRLAQKTLAHDATTILHGKPAAEAAERAALALFSGDVASLDKPTLEEVFAAVPATEHPKASLAGDGISLVDLLPETSICKSKREAREFLGNGAVSVNGQKVGPDDTINPSRLLHDQLAIIRRGKKAWHVTRWV